MIDLENKRGFSSWTGLVQQLEEQFAMDVTTAAMVGMKFGTPIAVGSGVVEAKEFPPTDYEVSNFKILKWPFTDHDSGTGNDRRIAIN